MSGSTEVGLRADAARNRARLVSAAREVFSQQGLNVSMRQVARHAGVSEPTLRRRFASKEELVAEAFGDQVAVSKLEVRWAGAETVTYPIERIDTLVTIDQRSGRITYGF